MQKYNTIAKRHVAVIIDGIILYPVTLLESLYMNKGIVLFTTGTLGVAVLCLLYFVLLHAKYGQAIGKKIAGVKVLDINELRFINLIKSILRESPQIVINLGITIYVVSFFSADLSKTEQVFYDTAYISNVSWIVLDLSYALSNKKRRTIHDLIADSVVINVPD